MIDLPPERAHRLAARLDYGYGIALPLETRAKAFVMADQLCALVDGQKRGFNLRTLHGPFMGAGCTPLERRHEAAR